MSVSQQVAALRAINYRLSSTPAEQLPFVARQIASSIWTVRSLLRATANSGKDQVEASLLVHRFRTTLSSLLQDRTVQGRWAAVVMTKAAVEAAGIESLSNSGAWIKALLGILKKPGPSTTRILATITLTRIFTLTWADTNIVREMTTPTLPVFIASCMSNIEKATSSASELQTVLEAFAALLPRHPAIFRTYESHIRGLLATILSSPTSDEQCETAYSADQCQAANRLLALLHHSAAKQVATDRWEKTLQSTVAAAHEIFDVLFTPIMEIWSYSRPSHEAGGVAPDASLLGSNPWTGAHSGAARLIKLLGGVHYHLELSSGRPVNVQLGAIFRLIRRILSVSASDEDGVGAAKSNPDATREEREAMHLILPDIHVAALHLVDTILDRFNTAVAPIVHGLIDAVGQVFVRQRFDDRIRKAVYETLQGVLRIAGPAMSREDVSDIVPIIRACCSDLILAPAIDAASKTKVNGISQTPLGTKLGPSDLILRKNGDATASDGLTTSAAALLSLLFSHLNQSYLPRKLRGEMERTAILVKDREALLASVLNPFRKDDKAALQPSLLPILARLYPEAPEVEALLRPRMPPIIRSGRDIAEDGMNGLEEAEEDDDELVDQEYQGAEVHENVVKDVTSDPSSIPTATARTSVVEEAVVGGGLASSTPQPVHMMADGIHHGATSSLGDHGSGIKRSAEEDVDESLGAKRPRSGSMPHPSMSKADSVSHRAIASSGGEGIVRDGFPASLNINEAPASLAVIAEETRRVEQSDDLLASITAGEDGDSDFEIPEINPDPDTDSEDEDENEDENGP